MFRLSFTVRYNYKKSKTKLNIYNLGRIAKILNFTATICKLCKVVLGLISLIITK